MNLAQFSLVVCSTILVFAPAVAQSAQAKDTEFSESAQAQSGSEQLSTYAWGSLGTASLVSDPQVPRGCMCNRCLQSAERLQGQFPKF